MATYSSILCFYANYTVELQTPVWTHKYPSERALRNCMLLQKGYYVDRDKEQQGEQNNKYVDKLLSIFNTTFQV